MPDVLFVLKSGDAPFQEATKCEEDVLELDGRMAPKTGCKRTTSHESGSRITDLFTAAPAVENHEYFSYGYPVNTWYKE